MLQVTRVFIGVPVVAAALVELPIVDQQSRDAELQVSSPPELCGQGHRRDSITAHTLRERRRERNWDLAS